MFTWLAELFLIKEEYFSGKKAKARVLSAYIIASLIILGIAFVFITFISPMKKQHDTKEKLLSISHLLVLEKEQTNTYPDEIGSIARRNPTYGDLTTDSWNNEIIYQKSENNQDFTLTSKGKDGVLGTEDDIIVMN